jgi:hypothetical protein
MRNKVGSFLSAAVLLSILTAAVFSCKKDKTVTPDKQVAFFLAADVLGKYTITAPTQTYKVYVGLTKPATESRTVNVAVTSPTGAAAGAQYALSTSTVTFPAGSVLDSIIVTAVYAQYAAGRKDTLTFKFTNAEDGLPTLNNVYKIYVRGPCFEGDFEANAFKGTYNQTTETFGAGAPYGPYTTTISAVTLLTPTTGKITVTNIWDFGWGPIDFILDWTDPVNRTVVPVTTTSGIADATTLDPSFAGQQVMVRPFAGSPGTFSFCNGTIVLKMQLGASGTGYFGSLYTVMPKR